MLLISVSAGLPDALDADDKKHAYVGVVDVHFLKEHPGHMLFQGPGHTHWISEDYGKTYNAVDTPGGTLGYGRCAWPVGLHARPAEPRSCCLTTQILTSPAGLLCKLSRREGCAVHCSEIKIHPTHPDWVLARVRRNECLKVCPGKCQTQSVMQKTRGYAWSLLPLP